MGRLALTMLGLALLAGGAIFFAKNVLTPAQENVERSEPVLTGQYQPRVEECGVLEDADLPEGIAPPGVDEDVLYVQVVVFFPGIEKVTALAELALDEVNEHVGRRLEPIHTDTEVTAEGTYVYLVFQTTTAFHSARLVRGDDVLADRVELP